MNCGHCHAPLCCHVSCYRACDSCRHARGCGQQWCWGRGRELARAHHWMQVPGRQWWRPHFGRHSLHPLVQVRGLGSAGGATRLRLHSDSRQGWDYACTCCRTRVWLLCCAVLCCAVLCCAVLCCAVLCCAVLCCAVLCCAVLCCACDGKTCVLAAGQLLCLLLDSHGVDTYCVRFPSHFVTGRTAVVPVAGMPHPRV
jgi:hypothetical protein